MKFDSRVEVKCVFPYGLVSLCVKVAAVDFWILWRCSGAWGMLPRAVQVFTSPSLSTHIHIQPNALSCQCVDLYNSRRLVSRERDILQSLQGFAISRFHKFMQIQGFPTMKCFAFFFQYCIFTAIFQQKTIFWFYWTQNLYNFNHNFWSQQSQQIWWMILVWAIPQ